MTDQTAPAASTETPAAGAPATPAATGTEPAAPAQTSAPQAPAAPEVPEWAKDPATALAEVQKARQEAAAARTASRDQAKATARAELLKELGLTTENEPADPAKLAADLQASRSSASDAQRELAIYRTAPAGTDVTALLDSRAFQKAVSSIDPTDTAALAAAIETAVKGNSRFKASQAAAASGVDLTPGDASQQVFTRKQLADPAFYRQNRTAILAAQREGRIR